MTVRTALVTLVLALATGSCAATTYDNSISVGTVAATTTTQPVGKAADLLPQLVDESARVSKLIVDGGDKTAAIERVEALWKAVHDEVVAGDRDLAAEIEAEIAKSRRAVVRNIPGAADKAYRNLTVLVKAYLASA